LNILIIASHTTSALTLQFARAVCTSSCIVASETVGAFKQDERGPIVVGNPLTMPYVSLVVTGNVSPAKQPVGNNHGMLFSLLTTLRYSQGVAAKDCSYREGTANDEDSKGRCLLELLKIAGL
jgi:hypothetical protein